MPSTGLVYTPSVFAGTEELIEIAYREELRKQGIIRYFGGKQEFMHRGVLDDVDMSFLVHTSVVDQFSCDRGSNGCTIKEATFLGKSAHAGGSPHNGANALYAANCAMQAANALRETFIDNDHIRFHPIMHGVNCAVNIIPDRMELEKQAFVERVYQGYLEIAKEEPERVVLIDGDRSIEEIELDTRRVLTERIAATK